MSSRVAEILNEEGEKEECRLPEFKKSAKCEQIFDNREEERCIENQKYLQNSTILVEE